MISDTSRARLPAFAWLAIGLVFGFWLARLAMLEKRGFNPDELQHAHGAWAISKGMVPYKDYFEHHTPWLHYGLAWVLQHYDAEVDSGEAIRFLVAGRRTMWAITGLCLVATFWLGRLWATTGVGVFAAFCLSGIVMFLTKTLEIRPDVPAMLLQTSAVCLLVVGVRSARRKAFWLFAASGLGFGSSVMFTQKQLFAAPGFAAAVLVYVFLGASGDRLHRAVMSVLPFAVATALPLAATTGYFWLSGGANDFVQSNFLLALDWKSRLPWHGILLELVEQNPFICALIVLGFVVSTFEMRRETSVASGAYVVPLVFASTFVGTFIIPVPHRQYALTFLPLAAVFGGYSLSRLVEQGRAAHGCNAGPGFPRVFALSAIMLLALVYSASSSEGWFVYQTILVGVAILGALGLVAYRPSFGMGAMLVLLFVTPAYQARVFVEDSMWAFKQNLRYVLDNTSPEETILDGFTGLGVFRPHAFFYFFLHGEIRPLLGQTQWHELRDGLEDGRIHPKLVVMDRHLKAMPTDVVSFLDENYQPLERRPLRARIGPRTTSSWVDGGVRRLAPGDSAGTNYVLLEKGWSPAMRQGFREFRQSRGRRSVLLFPVQSPRDCDLILRAKLEFHDVPVVLSVSVNGIEIGETQLKPGWSDYTFRLPDASLIRGLNELYLTYSTTPFRHGRSAARGNAVISAEHLILIPRAN